MAVVIQDPLPICVGCQRRPHQIDEYVEAAKEFNYRDPDAFVKNEEGTYNRRNGHFACTVCYIRMGEPALPAPERWVAP